MKVKPIDIDQYVFLERRRLHDVLMTEILTVFGFLGILAYLYILTPALMTPARTSINIAVIGATLFLTIVSLSRASSSDREIRRVEEWWMERQIKESKR